MEPPIQERQVVFAKFSDSESFDSETGTYFRVHRVTKEGKVFESLGSGCFRVYDAEDVRLLTPEEIGPAAR